MKNRLLLWSITASLAGFLFGFDTIVISGAEEDFQRLWQLDGFWHGLCMSAALWGTVLGSIFGGIPAARYGRRKCLIVVGFLYFISAVASAFAPEPWTFMIARFIGGLGVGAATIAAPMFISEMSPAKSRGKLAGMFQFNIVFGILVAFASNWIVGNTAGESIAWRLMLGLEAVPALIYMFLAFTLPESPRWLITHANKRDEGKAVFRHINPDMPDAELEELVAEVEASVADKKKTARFWTRRLQVPIMLAFLIAFFNQFSGINIILYFAPRLLGLAGLSNPLMASISLGITNLIFTFAGLALIDKLGRRTLLYIGSVGYIAAHAIGQGTVIWVFIGEIFPNDHRAAGQALGSATHWVCAAGLSFLYPVAMEHFEPGQLFGFFTFMMVLQLLWVKMFVPETKGVPLEEMQSRLGIAEEN